MTVGIKGVTLIVLAAAAVMAALWWFTLRPAPVDIDAARESALRACTQSYYSITEWERESIDVHGFMKSCVKKTLRAMEKAR